MPEGHFSCARSCLTGSAVQDFLQFFAERCINALVLLQVSNVDPKSPCRTLYRGPTPTNGKISIDIQALLFPTRCPRCAHQAMAIGRAAMLLTQETLGWCRGCQPGCGHLRSLSRCPPKCCEGESLLLFALAGRYGGIFQRDCSSLLRYPAEHPF